MALSEEGKEPSISDKDSGNDFIMENIEITFDDNSESLKNVSPG